MEPTTALREGHDKSQKKRLGFYVKCVVPREKERLLCKCKADSPTHSTVVVL